MKFFKEINFDKILNYEVPDKNRCSIEIRDKI